MEPETAKAELNSSNEGMVKMLLELRGRQSNMVRSLISKSLIVFVLTYEIHPEGRDNDFDVVLIDTAGRMQDNEVCIYPSITVELY